MLGCSFKNTITVGNAISLNGPGVAGSGALSVSTGTATLTGNVTLQSASTINLSQANTGLEITGTLALGANTLSSSGNQRLILSGPIVGSGTLNLTSAGGLTIINNDNTSTYSGPVVVSRHLGGGPQRSAWHRRADFRPKRSAFDNSLDGHDNPHAGKRCDPRGVDKLHLRLRVDCSFG